MSLPRTSLCCVPEREATDGIGAFLRRHVMDPTRLDDGRHKKEASAWGYGSLWFRANWILERVVWSLMLKLDPVPKVITFDCYGTLVQWHSAVREAARAILSTRLSGDEAEDQATALADRLRAAAVARQERPPYCDYKSVLQSSLDEALSAVGQRGTPADQ